MLKLENNKAFSVWSAQFFREYLLHSVILSMMVNKETDLLAFLLRCSGWPVTLRGAERLMQASLLLHSLLCFLLFVYFL